MKDWQQKIWLLHFSTWRKKLSEDGFQFYFRNVPHLSIAIGKYSIECAVKDQMSQTEEEELWCSKKKTRHKDKDRLRSQQHEMRKEKEVEKKKMKLLDNQYDKWRNNLHTKFKNNLFIIFSLNRNKYEWVYNNITYINTTRQKNHSVFVLLKLSPYRE